MLFRSEDYEKRAFKDPGLNYLKNRIKISAELNSKAALSLNLESRKLRKMQYEQNEIVIKNEYLKAVGKDPIEKPSLENTGIEDAKTILMNQTHLVMADFIKFSKGLGFSW